MSDIPHAHNTPRALGYTREITKPRKLHWLSEPKYVACGSEMYTRDFTNDEDKWSRAGAARCKGCEKKHPPVQQT